MEFTANQIAELINGTVEGDPEITVTALSKIEEGKANTLSFLANPKYTEYIYETDASVVIVSREFKPEKKLKPSITLIRVDDPYQSFAKLLETYNRMRFDKKGIDDNAVIDASAEIGEECYIGPSVTIAKDVRIGNNVKIYPNCSIGENVRIDDNTVIHQGVTIYHDTVIGKNCMIHSGVVLGCDGFGFAPNSENNYNKVAQIGNVVLKDQVEVGANTTIDRATLGSTVIHKGVKLDNLIQIAHNVEIGENTVIAAQTGIAGSTSIGKNCMIGGQVGIIGHLKIGDGVKIAAQSGIGSDVKDGMILQGSPAFHIGDYKRSYVGFRKLPKIMDQISEIKKQLKNFNKNVNS